MFRSPSPGHRDRLRRGSCQNVLGLVAAASGTDENEVIGQSLVWCEKNSQSVSKATTIFWRIGMYTDARKIRLSAIDANTVGHSPLTLNSRGWRRVPLANTERLRPHC